MLSNQIGVPASQVPPPAYTPATRKPADDENTSASKTNPELDQLLNQLTSVLTASVSAQDSATPQALLQLFSPGGGDTQAVPADLLGLISQITGRADAAGRGDEFKALLREYVAVSWSLAELDAAIKAEQAGQVDAAAADYHYAQLASANAFMLQLSTELTRQLDSLANQNGYTDWLQAFRQELEARRENNQQASSGLPRNLDAAQLVAHLLNQAPRPESEELKPAAVH